MLTILMAPSHPSLEEQETCVKRAKTTSLRGYSISLSLSLYIYNSEFVGLRELDLFCCDFWVEG